ncbi:MAG TPA: hypothetical protein VK586_21075 [Streptosporangiaceae bacterium]|nr:hypothetical protein [Streptosporangiaceae bacterium]
MTASPACIVEQLPGRDLKFLTTLEAAFAELVGAAPARGLSWFTS